MWSSSGYITIVRKIRPAPLPIVYYSLEVDTLVKLSFTGKVVGAEWMSQHVLLPKHDTQCSVLLCKSFFTSCLFILLLLLNSVLGEKTAIESHWSEVKWESVSFLTNMWSVPSFQHVPALGGNEVFDVYKAPLQGDHSHLFIRQGTGLQGQAVFKTKLTFR